MQTNRCARATAASLAALAMILVLSCGGEEEAIPEAERQGGVSALAIPEGEEAPPNLAPEPDKVVATVNGAEIRAEQVYEVASINMAEMAARGMTFTEEQEAMHRVLALDLIMDNELLMQEAEKQGIPVDPAVLEEQFRAVKEQKGSEEEFRSILVKADASEDELREELARRLQMQNYAKILTRDVKVTDEEALAHYEANRDQFMTPEMTQASYILIHAKSTDPEPLRQRARAKAEEAHARAMAGEDFAELAREYSQAPNAAKGGDLGMFPRGVMFPVFEKIAFETEIGGISEVFETVTGYNVLKVTGRKPAEPIPFEEIRPRLKLRLISEKEGQVMQAALAELRKTARVEILDEELVKGMSDEAN